MKCAVAFILLATVSCSVSKGLKTVNPYVQNEVETANYFFNTKPVIVDCSSTYMSVRVDSLESLVGFFSVDFGEGGATSVRVGAGAAYSNGQRSLINFHLDSPTTKPFTTVEILNTGSWEKMTHYYAGISVYPTGVHDVYATFASADALDTVCYFDTLLFYQ